MVRWWIADMELLIPSLLLFDLAKREWKRKMEIELGISESGSRLDPFFRRLRVCKYRTDNPNDRLL